MKELRKFEHWPDDLVCPVCKGSDDSPCTLIPKDGTKDGNICKAIPVHVSCLASDGWRIATVSGVDIIYRQV